MAGYNELLVGRYNRFLQKLMSMKGSKSLESLNPELHVVLQTFHGVENRYLEGWNRFQSNEFQPQVAAQQSTVRYRNPVGSNIIMAFESLIVSNGATADQFIFERSNIPGFSTDLSSIVALSFAESMDLRVPSGRTCIISSQAAAGQSTNMVQIGSRSAQALQSVDFVLFEDQEIPLLPGQAIQIRESTVNIALTVAATWRERFLEESERT